MSRKLAAVILAAGQGTRMKSDLPKVLHPVAGKSMLSHVVETARALDAAPIVPVIGHRADLVRTEMGNENLIFALQSEQLGTGHALQCAEASLRAFEGDLMLLCGDVPLLRDDTLQALLHHHRKNSASITILTALMADPTGYGRIIRGPNGVERIVEEKDASSTERQVNEINTGIYLFRAPEVFDFLQKLDNQNAQGEYYLTDVVAAARKAGERVEALLVENAEEAMGINDRVQLAQAGGIMRQRINEIHQRAGVTLIDPAATYIDPDVVIGPDTLIHPGVHLRGKTIIGSNCEIEPGVVVTDCTIGDHAHLKPGSVLSESILGDSCAVGPMAHLRPGTVLAGNNKIGNFVETKKAVIGEKSQASHLTYIGDATLGKNVNIGCGTITCNYDGVNKYQTTIEDDVFVGSDTQFIAPVTIGRGSLIGAGSTITKDVPADALALSRSEQKNIAGWAERNRKKLQRKKSTGKM
ncbi:MAG: bifunctional UDP-N-acetylglucosamine diphosphorylase/glucosamine-1-phosphate N-acetyltransferase GlmU [Deltaproteobacteria bacterium]|nr:MAG: bifunctional UDP-N-acetylglucosamine diphosphorylase/glucosamine-1-phosphate N-acetyltransferase GlmU [Deltaproteobacteria bacterium]